MHYAAGTGHKVIAVLLIAEGADVNAKSDSGSTPLDWAIRRNVTETADLLCKHGGKTSSWFKAGESIHIAAAAGHIKAVKQHLAAGTDVNAKEVDGETSLHYADTKEIAVLLIAEGVDVNVKNDAGFTPLHHAAVFGRKEIAELLIAEGADVNAKEDEYGITPLHEAAFVGYKEIAELLIAKGGDVNAKDVDGGTPLDAAQSVNEDVPPEDKAANKEIADLLRKHGGKTSEELKAEGK